MKTFILLLAASLAYAAPTQEQQTLSIKSDIHDFLEVIPVEKIKKIALQHLHDDPEFQAAIKYLRSPEWKGLVAELFAEPAAIELYNFLKEAGLDLEDIQHYICGFLKDIKVETDHPTRSFKSFMEDVRKVIPLAAVIDMFDNKTRNSPAFSQFYEKISGKESHRLVTALRAVPVYKKITAEFLIMGIDIEAMLRIMHGIFGWEMKPLEQL